MIIEIDKNTIIDTELDFDNQSQEAQAYVFNMINTIQPITSLDSYNRPVTQVYANELVITTVTSVYKDQSTNRVLESQKITLDGTL